MLMSRTSRQAVEALVELTGHGSQEWMNAAELSRRIDAEVPFLKQVLNRLTRADFRGTGQHSSRHSSIDSVLHCRDGWSLS